MLNCGLCPSHQKGSFLSILCWLQRFEQGYPKGQFLITNHYRFTGRQHWWTRYAIFYGWLCSVQWEKIVHNTLGSLLFEGYSILENPQLEKAFITNIVGTGLKMHSKGFECHLEIVWVGLHWKPYPCKYKDYLE